MQWSYSRQLQRQPVLLQLLVLLASECRQQRRQQAPAARLARQLQQLPPHQVSKFTALSERLCGATSKKHKGSSWDVSAGQEHVQILLQTFWLCEEVVSRFGPASVGNYSSLLSQQVLTLLVCVLRCRCRRLARHCAGLAVRNKAAAARHCAAGCSRAARVLRAAAGQRGQCPVFSACAAVQRCHWHAAVAEGGEPQAEADWQLQLQAGAACWVGPGAPNDASMGTTGACTEGNCAGVTLVVWSSGCAGTPFQLGAATALSVELYDSVSRVLHRTGCWRILGRREGEGGEVMALGG